MTNFMTKRTSAASLAVIVGLSALALGACSKTDPAASAASTAPAAASQQVSAHDASGSDSLALVNAAVDIPAAGEAPDGSDRRGLRARLLRALHATWVTESQQGPVTHQAIRGDVTAVSTTSITVKAKDGVSITFAVTPDTTVRQRVSGSGKGTKATTSTIGAVTVGTKALVTGVGASSPTARVVVHVVAAAPQPSPSATS